MLRIGLYLVFLVFLTGCGGEQGRGTLLTHENHPDGWRKSNCLACHQSFDHGEIYKKEIERALTTVGKENSIQICSACHGTNGFSSSEVRTRCLVCHEEREELHFYVQKTTSFHDFNGNGKLDDTDCMVCHPFSNMNGIFEPALDLREKDVETLCLNCHREVAVHFLTTDWHGRANSPSAVEFQQVNYKGQSVFSTNRSLSCVQCHNPHASGNPSLLIEKAGEVLVIKDSGKLITPLEGSFVGVVSFDGKSYELSDPEQLKDYLNLKVNDIPSLCSLCHTKKINPQEHYGNDCINCHAHGKVF